MLVYLVKVPRAPNGLRMVNRPSLDLEEVLRQLIPDAMAPAGIGPQMRGCFRICEPADALKAPQMRSKLRRCGA